MSILEVGCSTGEILYEFKKRGADVLGCDPGPWKQIAKERYDIEIINDFFDSSMFPDQKFDIIYSFAFLDQMSNPFDILNQMKKLLKSDGSLVTAVRDYKKHLEIGRKWKSLIGQKFIMMLSITKI